MKVLNVIVPNTSQFFKSKDVPSPTEQVSSPKEQAPPPKEQTFPATEQVPTAKNEEFPSNKTKETPSTDSQQFNDSSTDKSDSSDSSSSNFTTSQPALTQFLLRYVFPAFLVYLLFRPPSVEQQLHKKLHRIVSQYFEVLGIDASNKAFTVDILLEKNCLKITSDFIECFVQPQTPNFIKLFYRRPDEGNTWKVIHVINGVQEEGEFDPLELARLQELKNRATVEFLGQEVRKISLY